MSMKQLTGMDATFLYMETPETPMHVAGLTLYDLPDGFKGSFHQHFKTFFRNRVHLIPIFGKKLAKSMFQLDHPGWVDAGPLDLDHHIKGITLPKPGNWKQLEDLVAELHAETLDRTQPLWEFTVIEGLESGQAALYSKVHHAAVDGGAGMVITKALYDITPVPREVEPPTPHVEQRKPTRPERAILGLHDMATNLMRQQMRLIEGVPKMAGQVADLVAPVLSGTLSLPQIMAPKTPFNGTIGKSRSYVARTVSMGDIKAMCKASDTKINDMVMAICAGALRRYLDEKHILPDAPLTAFVPISMRELGNTDINNQVFGMNCVLATNYSDPLKRLKKINSESRSSKTIAGGVKDVAPNDFTLLGAPMLLPGLMQLYGRTKLADIVPNTVNVTISNTQGPPIPLYCAGAKVTALYPVSIPIHGVGLNFTVQSYMDSLDFGITADKGSVPDIDHLGELLVGSFNELRALLLGEPAPAAAPAKPATTPAKPTAGKPSARKPAAKASPKAAPKVTTKAAPEPRAKTAAKTSAKASAPSAGTAAPATQPAAKAKAPEPAPKPRAKAAGKTATKTSAPAPKTAAAKPAPTKPATKAAPKAKVTAPTKAPAKAAPKPRAKTAAKTSAKASTPSASTTAPATQPAAKAKAPAKTARKTTTKASVAASAPKTAAAKSATLKAAPKATATTQVNAPTKAPAKTAAKPPEKAPAARTSTAQRKPAAKAAAKAPETEKPKAAPKTAAPTAKPKLSSKSDT